MVRRFILIVLTLNSIGCFAQINYQDNLIASKKNYDLGYFNEAIVLAEACISSTSTNDLCQAYRMLSLCYLGLYQNENAKASAIKMLQLNPSYHASTTNDPADFIKLLTTITVIPKWSFGIVMSLGTNLSLPKITQSYVLGNYQKTYTAKFGTQFSTHTDFYISHKSLISINLGVIIKKLDVGYTLPNWNISAKENLTYLQMPILYQHILNPTKKVRFFAQVGPNFGRLMYDKMSFTATSSKQVESQSLQKVNVIDRRNEWNLGLMVGGGFYVKMKKSYLNVQLNYQKSLNLINNAKTRFGNIEQMYTYFYLDDDISIDNLVLSVGLAKMMSFKVYNKKRHE